MSKAEKLFWALGWLGMMVFVYFLLVKPSEESIIAMFVLTVGFSFELILILFGIYVKIRQNIIRNRIYELESMGRAEECMQVIEKFVKNHQKCKWIQVEQCKAYAVLGNIPAFYAKKEELVRAQLLFHKKRFFAIVQMENILNFFHGEGEPFAIPYFQKKRNTYAILANQMIFAFENQNYSRIESDAPILFEAPIPFYKCLAMLLLAKVKNVTDGMDTAKMYWNAAIDSAPSESIKKYIVMQLSQTSEGKKKPGIYKDSSTYEETGHESKYGD